MIAPPLSTSLDSVHLIEPNIDRDANLGMQWLKGVEGYNTLKLMGVPDAFNKPTTLEQEKKRVSEFISNDHQLNWMIEYKGAVIGTIWVDLEKSEDLPDPAVSLMIGDPNARGQGIGQAALSAVIQYFQQKGTPDLYSRHLIENTGSKHLFEKLGFTPLGETYTDEDGLTWQNLRLTVNL